jgi:hypothetical protein
MTRLRMGKSVHRWEVVNPAAVRLRIFTPFCFGSCMMPQQFEGLYERKLRTGATGARCVQKKKKKYYIILQGANSLVPIFLSAGADPGFQVRGGAHLKKLPHGKFTHGKVCTQMGSGQPSSCTTSDFHAVLFWFVYDTSAVRRPALTIKLKDKHLQ